MHTPDRAYRHAERGNRHRPVGSARSLLTAAAAALALLASPAAAADRDLPLHESYFVFFMPESAEIVPAARPILDQAAADAARSGVAGVTVRAYAAKGEGAGEGEDAADAPRNPAAIAAERATAVAEILVANGVAADEVQIQVVGIAPQPAPALTPEMDRRVEILLDPGYRSYSVLQDGGRPWVATLR